ncbi:TetR/AcrR family transcriptional regulator [Lichenifustis flavocetrariae]|uniref:TetR/AcrR family transcriptional regulator n=1 Tax=Lichenifustis flavocetrariae TaxID=2949735 RepID=A0AA41YZH6_9HYPH|nr:TetR family transcriptional regulator [Lichenifustis flavocetrariae]MCW6507748.1 TetR/AcrR family transcriptional regulator [Lichenifustis flavocetrariae]
MEAARLTVQDLGYSGLSFRELAKDVGIKSASIHYYFETKGALGAALAARYTAHYAEVLDGLLAEGLDVKTCMTRYVDIFGDTLRHGNRMCLAGILSAERNELPEEVRAEVVKYGEMNERWLERVLAMHETAEPDEIRRRARAIYAAVQGAQLIAHSRGDVSVYEDIVATYRANGMIP